MRRSCGAWSLMGTVGRHCDTFDGEAKSHYKETSMTSTKIVCLTALTLASTALLASGPESAPQQVQIRMGSTVYVSFTSDVDGKVTRTWQKTPPKSGPFVSFALSQIGTGNPDMAGNPLLVVTNKYDKALSYKARECLTRDVLCDIATVASVKAGSMSHVSWGRGLYAIEVSAAILE
jgi:hypothetical protein